MTTASDALPIKIVHSPIGVPRVYTVIAAIAGELAQSGIGKTRQNQQQHYNFRGIDDVYNALAPLLAKHQLVILPRMLARACLERTTQKGSVLFYVTVDAEFDFVAAEDGSSHTVKTFGEAMDSADKATNKAMSAAYKYAAFQAFCIPTEGDNDADATTHDLAPAVPIGLEDWIFQLEAIANADGIDALRAAWKNSPAEFRKFMTEHKRDEWEAIKARAQQSAEVPA